MMYTFLLHHNDITSEFSGSKLDNCTWTENSDAALCIFQRVSVDGSTMSCKSSDEESSLSLLVSHGVSSQQFAHMSLPSFRPTYLFLVRIPLDIIHECLKLRLEQRPDKDPSLLSLQSVRFTPASGDTVLLLLFCFSLSSWGWWVG